MALVFKDRVKETTTTTGTGIVTLAGAEAGFQAFSVIGNANTTYYTIVSGNNWEVGLGTYLSSGTTLSRDTVLESSNSGSKITLAGTSDVFCTYPAEKAVTLNGTVINDADVVATANIVDDNVTTDKLANSINTEITANTAKVTNATHTGDVTGATALTIASDAVVTAKILDLNVTEGKLANNAVTLAKMAGGTDGELITYDTSGNPANVPAGTAGQILTSAGADAVPTFQTAASSASENLQKSFTLTTGKTVTAGIMVSVDASGEVGTLPSINTLGTYRVTANTHQYGGINSIDDSSGGISHNGSRGLSFSGTASYNDILRAYSGSQGSRVVTVTGHAFSSGATTVDGTTTVTVPIPNSAGPTSLDGATSAHPYDGAWQVFCYPVSDTSFMVMTQSGSGNAATPISNQTSWNYDWSATIVTVDASGDLTKGTTQTSTHTSSVSPGGGIAINSSLQRKLSNNTFVMCFNFDDGTYILQEPTYNLKRVIKWTSGTSAQINKSNFASTLSEIVATHTYPGSVRTSGNKIVWNNYLGYKMISIADSDGGLGNTASATFVARASIPVTAPGIAMVGDQYDPGFRLPLDETKLYWTGYNYTGTNTRVIVPITISSAGVAALDVGTYDTGNTDAARVDNPEYGTICGTSDGTLALAGFRTIGGALFVNTFAMNSDGRVLLGNLGLGVTGGAQDNRSAVRWTGSEWLLFIRETNSLSANQVTVNLALGAQSTLPINFVGFPTATDSSSPATIVVDGVASGFSSLTPGEFYYEDVLHNGTVSLLNTSGVKIGKAISTTEILIDRII